MSISKLEFKIWHRADRGHFIGIYSSHIAYLAFCLEILDTCITNKTELPPYIRHTKNKIGQEYLIFNEEADYSILLQGSYGLPIAAFTAKLLIDSHEIVFSNSSIIHFLYMNRFRISRGTWNVWIPLSAIALSYRSPVVHKTKELVRRYEAILNTITSDLVISDYRWGIILEYLQRIKFK